MLGRAVGFGVLAVGLCVYWALEFSRFHLTL